MEIREISIEKFIVHETVKQKQLEETPPVHSNELITLDDNGEKLFQKRISDTLGKGGHCIDVTPTKQSDGTLAQDAPFHKITRLLDSNDVEFIQDTKDLADELSRAQIGGTVKGGSVIFTTGTCYYEGSVRRFICIIKADSDQGLTKNSQPGSIDLMYINDIILSHEQKLYKIGFYLELSRQNEKKARSVENFSIVVFDHLLQKSNESSGAQYFLSSFLKCKLLDNSAYQTRKFYEYTKSFINKLPIEQEKKKDIYDSLVVEMKSNNSELHPLDFARNYIPENNQDDFVNGAEEKGFTNSISKNTDLIMTKLRRMSIRFTSDVTVIAPSDKFLDYVKIGEINADGWTPIEIKGEVQIK